MRLSYHKEEIAHLPMKDARYLVRLRNALDHTPADQPMLLAALRRLAEPHGGRVLNLRVSKAAVEFDLFCPPSDSPEPFFEAWAPYGTRLSLKRLDLALPPKSDAEILREAQDLYAEERFWEVHEVLEELWRRLSPPEKGWAQALILAAAAQVHFQKDEGPVGQRMLEDAIERLKTAPAVWRGWPIRALTRALETLVYRRKTTSETRP